MTVARVPAAIGDRHVEAVGIGLPAVLWHSLFVDSRQWDRVRPAVVAGSRHLPPSENPPAVIDRVPAFWARPVPRDDQERP